MSGPIRGADERAGRPPWLESRTFDFIETLLCFATMMDKRVRDAVDELLQTYSETGGINYLDAAATLPSRPAIESACADLMSLMFPGFRGEAVFDSGDLPDVTRSRMRNLHQPSQARDLQKLRRLSRLGRNAAQSGRTSRLFHVATARAAQNALDRHRRRL